MLPELYKSKSSSNMFVKCSKSFECDTTTTATKEVVTHHTEMMPNKINMDHRTKTRRRKISALSILINNESSKRRMSTITRENLTLCKSSFLFISIISLIIITISTCISSTLGSHNQQYIDNKNTNAVQCKYSSLSASILSLRSYKFFYIRVLVKSGFSFVQRCVQELCLFEQNL